MSDADPIAIKDDTLGGATFTFLQEVDSNGPSEGSYNVLAVEITDAGGGHYVTIQTERWSLDPAGIDAFAARLKRCLEIVEKDATSEHGG